MTTAGKAAAPRAAAARSNGATKNGTKDADKDKLAKALDEVEEPQPKAIDFRGLHIDLPDELPPAVLFDLVDIEADTANPLPMFRLLKSMVGKEAFLQIRNKIDEADSLDPISDLLDAVFGQYGVSLGEAQASPDS